MPRMAAQVVLELLRARRRVDGHRDAAGQQDAEEAREVVHARRQHQRDGATRLHAMRSQPGGDARRGLPELGVADGTWVRAVLVEQDVHRVRRPSAVPVQQFRQGADGVRRGPRRLHAPAGHGCKRRVWRLRRRGAQQVEQTPRGRRQQGLVRQPSAEFALDAVDELGTAEAVETQIGFQPCVQTDVLEAEAFGAGREAGFPGQPPHDSEESGFDLRRGRRNASDAPVIHVRAPVWHQPACRMTPGGGLP
jgi:hypothetical protein